MAESESKHEDRKLRNFFFRSVDENDYRVLEELFRNGTTTSNTDDIALAREIFSVCRFERFGYRVQMITVPNGARPIPKCVVQLDALEELSLPKGVEVPRWLGRLENLRSIMIALGEGQTMSEGISGLSNLKTLIVNGERHASIPICIGNLPNLKFLCINLAHIPHDIGNFTNIETLSFLRSTKSLPSSIGSLKNLKRLSFHRCVDLQWLPDEIGALTGLECLEIKSRITTLPRSIGNLKNLKVLKINTVCAPVKTVLLALPEEIGNLTSLEQLDLGQSEMESLPEAIGKLKNLKILNLYGSVGFSTLPNSIGNLTELEYLNLKFSEIERFPPSFGNLSSLVLLNLSGEEPLKEFPDAIRNLSKLQYLICDRPSSTIPAAITCLRNLRVLHLSEDLYHIESALPVLSTIVEENPQLGCLALGDRCVSSLQHSLICNRARGRLLRIGNNGDGLPLWPQILERGTVAFSEYSKCKKMHCTVCSSRWKQSDAVFQLLVDYGARIIENRRPRDE